MRENRMDENVTIVYTAYVTLRNGHRLYAKPVSYTHLTLPTNSLV